MIFKRATKVRTHTDLEHDLISNAEHNKSFKLSSDDVKLIVAHGAVLFVGEWIRIAKPYARGDKTYSRIVYVCPNCGNEVTQALTFCGECGARLNKNNETKDSK